MGYGLLLLILSACKSEEAEKPLQNGPMPDIQPGAPSLRRLTEAQYIQTVQDILGKDIALPGSLEPDVEIEGFLSIGAAVNATSALGVERYESAAFSLAEQVATDPNLRANVLPCTPTSADDTACASQFVQQFGRLAWRRALTEAESSRISSLITRIGAESGDFNTGLEFGMAAFLQSPYFLYRLEHGQPDPENSGRRILTGTELATRLSYLLWNTTPDDTLLSLAEAGELDSDTGLEQQARLMLADARAEQGERNLFTELFTLYALDELSKDPTVFNHASTDLGPAAREETLRTVVALIDQGQDFRDLLTTQETYVDPLLAALYQVQAPSLDGFAPTTLDAAAGRRGLLGQASFLMLNAHTTRTSATLRGKFVREVLLCQGVPPPPGNVNTSVIETDTSGPTLRDRLEAHLADPTCAACHRSTDPIGLGLENFDGIGRWRETENEVTIDASGDLDGEAFSDAWDLAAAVRSHPNLGPCMTTHLYSYAVGHGLTEDEETLRDWLSVEFEIGGYTYKDLVMALVMSPGFRQVGEVQ